MKFTDLFLSPSKVMDLNVRQGLGMIVWIIVLIVYISFIYTCFKDVLKERRKGFEYVN